MRIELLELFSVEYIKNQGDGQKRIQENKANKQKQKKVKKRGFNKNNRKLNNVVCP